MSTRPLSRTLCVLPDEILVKVMKELCIQPFNLTLEMKPEYKSLALTGHLVRIPDNAVQPLDVIGRPDFINIKLTNSFFRVEVNREIRGNFTGVLVHNSYCENVLDCIQRHTPWLCPIVTIFNTSFHPFNDILNPRFEIFSNLKFVQVCLNQIYDQPFERIMWAIESSIDELRQHTCRDSCTNILATGSKIRFQHRLTLECSTFQGLIVEGPQTFACAVELTENDDAIYSVGDSSIEAAEMLGNVM